MIAAQVGSRVSHALDREDAPCKRCAPRFETHAHRLTIRKAAQGSKEAQEKKQDREQAKELHWSVSDCLRVPLGENRRLTPPLLVGPQLVGGGGGRRRHDIFRTVALVEEWIHQLLRKEKQQ